MITDLRGLVEYSKQRAKEFPDIREEIEIRFRKEYNENRFSVPEGLKLPEVYLGCVEELLIYGVSIGGFDLWPCASAGRELFLDIFSANREWAPWRDVASACRLVGVARQENNIICVGELGTEAADKVVFIDCMSGKERSIVNVAPDFRAFLLLAANLEQLGDDYDTRPEQAAFLMKGCLDSLKCGSEYVDFWVRQVIARTG